MKLKLVSRDTVVTSSMIRLYLSRSYTWTDLAGGTDLKLSLVKFFGDVELKTLLRAQGLSREDRGFPGPGMVWGCGYFLDPVYVRRANVAALVNMGSNCPGISGTVPDF